MLLDPSNPNHDRPLQRTCEVELRPAAPMTFSGIRTVAAAMRLAQRRAEHLHRRMRRDLLRADDRVESIAAVAARVSEGRDGGSERARPGAVVCAQIRHQGGKFAPSIAAGC